MNLAIAMLVLCGLVFVVAIYFLFRSAWVLDRQFELIAYHYSSKVDWRAMPSIDAVYGSYNQWLFRRPFTWNPARLAGLPEWPA